jgi:acetylornithine deacetylase/succinyl-diaminopimelate desuccinylase-like protein
MIRHAIAPLLLALAACANAPGATPQQLRDRVAAFAQPTQEGRLAALKAQLEAAGLAFTVEEFAGNRPSPARGYNVTVRTGPATGKEILLVAHYDAVVLDNGKLIDGVIDNAASVVAMIEATRRLAGKTKHPVRLLLTDQEELGLVGAKAWTKAHGTTNLAAVVNADVNSYGDTLMYGLNNGPQSAGINNAVSDLCATRKMSCLDFPEYPPSDDLVFSGAGVPTVSLGFLPKAEAEKLRVFMQNPPASAPSPGTVPDILGLIHTPNDRIERVEASTLAAASDFFAALVMKLDADLD